MKVDQKFKDEFFSYFKVEQLEDGTLNAEYEIKQQQAFIVWLSMVTEFIQNCLTYHKVRNYLTVEMQTGKQKVEIAILKKFGTGPHALRVIAETENAKLRTENEELKKRIAELEQKRAHKTVFDSDTVCKGSIRLGTACLKCSKCLEESETIVANMNKRQTDKAMFDNAEHRKTFET